MAKLVAWCVVALLCSGSVLAQNNNEKPVVTAPGGKPAAEPTAELQTGLTTVPATTQQAEPSSTGLLELPDISSSNHIPLLDNRFRIDFEVKEITLVFFRKRGTPSVVLVRPDGSKIYSRNAKEQKVIWHDDKTYDLIKITNPVPGPWQAIGEVLPESRIMVLTDIDLAVDALPTDLMVGETLKVTARLTNGGKPINARDFRDILQLDVLLISTQKPEYDNHSQTVVEFASFRDDGKNFDERPRDAIFTGEFKLDFPAGEWIPKYIVKTPLYTRELIQDPIVVHRSPLTTEVVTAISEDSKHLVNYTITDGPALGDKVALQGRIRFPSEEVQSFTLGEQPSNTRSLAVVNAGVGTYRIEQTMFGKTKNGREFVMSLPEVTFAAVGPKIEVPQVDDATVAALKAKAAADANPQGAANTADSDTAETGAAHSDTAPGGASAASGAAAVDMATAAETSEPAKPFPLVSVILLNLGILLFGGGGILLLMSDNARAAVMMLFAKLNPVALLKRNKAQTNAAADQNKNADNSVGTAQKGQKNNEGGDILDLSLPDD